MKKTPFEAGYGISKHGRIAFVFNGLQFKRHVLDPENVSYHDLKVWAEHGYVHPVIYVGGFVWIYSPGRPPVPRDF